ncbi:MAG: protein kinase [Magnetococcales bacterium]|nr:protein kinase [Magnetococcales bacterium]
MDGLNIHHFLQQVPGFMEIPKEDLERIASLFSRKSFHAGEWIIRQGEMGHSMFVIYDGVVKIVLYDAKGKTKMTAMLGPSQLVGEMALLTRAPRSASVMAETDLEVLELQGTDLFSLLHTHPSLAHFLSTILNQRIQENGLIIGNYRIVDKIGQGQTSAVYAGVHPNLDRKVAIKMLFHSLAMDGGFVDRFLEEARIIAQLNHPNIVQIYDQINLFETFFIVMEKASGRDLKTILSERKSLSPAETVAIVRQWVVALQYAHSHNVIHRDVKPANCVIDSTGAMKVMDFGLARRSMADHRQGGVLMGSPKYIAPELIRGAPGDARSDMYALGVMAYEMLTGYAPFAGATVREVLIGHLRHEPPDINSKIANLPQGLAAFITGTLKKNPQERCMDYGEILDMLDRCSMDAARPDLESGFQLLKIAGPERRAHELMCSIQAWCQENGCRVIPLSGDQDGVV